MKRLWVLTLLVYELVAHQFQSLDRSLYQTEELCVFRAGPQCFQFEVTKFQKSACIERGVELLEREQSAGFAKQTNHLAHEISVTKRILQRPKNFGIRLFGRLVLFLLFTYVSAQSQCWLQNSELGCTGAFDFSKCIELNLFSK